MKLRINKIHYPVTTLGPGRRIGIWFQGCHIRCRGCVSRDTWDPQAGAFLEMESLLATCEALADEYVRGVTISGGEPFEQPEALEALLIGLRKWCGTLTEPLDILCYSGYSLGRLEREHPRILEELDVIIAGPFVESMPTEAALFGSANQRLVILSALGEQRYGRELAEDGSRELRVQVSVGEKEVWCIGIPRQGDLERVELAARERGVILDGVSWRA